MTLTIEHLHRLVSQISIEKVIQRHFATFEHSIKYLITSKMKNTVVELEGRKGKFTIEGEYLENGHTRYLVTDVKGVVSTAKPEEITSIEPAAK